MALESKVKRIFIGIGLILYDIFFVAFVTGSFDPAPKVTLGDDYVCEYAKLPENGFFDCGADKAHPFWPEPYATKFLEELRSSTTLAEYNDEQRKVLKKQADLVHYYNHRHDDPNAPEPSVTKKQSPAGDIFITIVSIFAALAIIIPVVMLFQAFPALGRWIAHGNDPLLLRILAIPLWLCGAALRIIFYVAIFWTAYSLINDIDRKLRR
jgi:hypothetical protein